MKDEEILKFVKEYMTKNGVTPSFREIGNGVGLKSVSSVNYYMNKLVTKGEIEWLTEKRFRVKGVKYVVVSE